MIIRFLQTTPSESPDHPFLAGQVIFVETPTPFLVGLLDGVRAQVVKDPEVEHATVQAPRRGRSRRTP